MASPSFDDDEKPLDPAMLRVQAKMRRLMLIAGLTLGLGILAVFGAILYKIVLDGDKAPLADRLAAGRRRADAQLAPIWGCRPAPGSPRPLPTDDG